jgi:hypothetical protein
MTSSPVESATARPVGVDRDPAPHVGAADPTAAVVRHAMARGGGAPTVGGGPLAVVAAAKVREGRPTAAADATQLDRADMRLVEDVTAAPGRREHRRNVVAGD